MAVWGKLTVGRAEFMYLLPHLSTGLVIGRPEMAHSILRRERSVTKKPAKCLWKRHFADKLGTGDDLLMLSLLSRGEELQ